MALRFIDGFETYGPVSTSTRVLQEAMSGRWDCLQSYADADISIQAGAHGGLSLFMDSSDDYITKTLDNQQTWVVGFWLKMDTYYGSVRPFLLLYDGTNKQCEIRIDSPNKKLEVWTDQTYRGESTTVLDLDTWYFVEAKFVIDATASGTYELKINGTSEVSGSAVTSDSGNDYASSLTILNNYNNFYIDDLYICDGTAGLDDFLGLCKVSVSYPTSDSSPSAWTTSTGSDHYALVNDSERDTSEYVYTDTNTNEDMYNFTVSEVGTILGLQFGVECSANGSVVKEFRAIVRNGNDSNASKVIMGGVESPQSILVAAEYLPGTSTAWTNTTINATDFGCEKVS